MEFQHVQMMLFGQGGNMLGNGLFTTGFGTFGCFDGGIATDEHGQNGAEGTTDRHNKKGVVRHRRRCPEARGTGSTVLCKKENR